MDKCLYISASKTGHKEIHICLKNIKEITNFVFGSAKTKAKFELIVNTFFENSTTKGIYEKYNDSVSAFKFKGTLNTRIYCKIHTGTPYRVVLSIIELNKNVQSLDKKLKTHLKSIKNKDYEFIKY